MSIGPGSVGSTLREANGSRLGQLERGQVKTSSVAGSHTGPMPSSLKRMKLSGSSGKFKHVHT